MDNTEIWQQFRKACRRLISEQDRDPYSLTRGCFDRRFWAWKIVDYSEATYQRGVYPLAWYLQHDPSIDLGFRQILVDAVLNGLDYASKIQHPDGSFDQAFPQEHSFGATAFLLDSLIKSYQAVRPSIQSRLRSTLDGTLRSASEFLQNHEEKHGIISNHIAGAALALFETADHFKEDKFERRAVYFLDKVLSEQSSEGWFVEYDGADPGYQSLCLHYLAQIHMLRPSIRLRDAIQRAIEFISWFVQPDGTFAGDYGSRRTALFYPGGLAILNKEFELASSILQTMQASITNHQTTDPESIDMGNLAPLLSTYTPLLELKFISTVSEPLPFQRRGVVKDFQKAGLYIRGNQSYYSILGVSNGGVLKVYDQSSKTLKFNDSGYVGRLPDKSYITTQITDLNHTCVSKDDEISFETKFYRMPQSLPAPLKFIFLRILNISIMHNIILGNLIKKILADLLIRWKRKVPLALFRTVRYERQRVVILDNIRMFKKLDLITLELGRPFVSIHMASAGYYQNPGACGNSKSGYSLPVEELIKNRTIVHELVV